MKKLIFVLLGGGSLVAMLGIVWLGISPEPQKENAETALQSTEEAVVPRTLVSRYPIKAGALLRPQDFYWAPLESDDNIHLNDVFLEGFTELKSLEGSLLTRHLSAGQMLNVSDIIRPDQSHYTSAMLSPGKRAVTLELSQAGVSHGLLRPGNYVDVVLTSENDHPDSHGTGVITKRSASVVLENTRLLAIGNTITDLVGGLEDDSREVMQGNDSYQPVRVTFEVSPDSATRLLLANQLGELSLMLRSHYSQESQLTSATESLWDEQISDNFHPHRKPEHAIRIFDGSNVRNQHESMAK